MDFSLLKSSAIFIALIISFIFYYHHKLIGSKTAVSDAWNNVKSMIKHRHEVIRIVVSTFKEMCKKERVIIEKVTQARLAAEEIPLNNIVKLGNAEDLLMSFVKELFIALAHYDNIVKLDAYYVMGEQIRQMEIELQKLHWQYNSLARKYNMLVLKFPSVVVAKLFGFKVVKSFKIHDYSEDIIITRLEK